MKWVKYAAGTVSLVIAYPAISAPRSIDESLQTRVDYAQTVSQRPVDVFPRHFTRLGTWKLFPQLEITEFYDSNIYAAPSNEKDDFITDIAPRARLASDWNVHSVQLELGANLGFYNRFTDENYQDYYAINQNKFEIVRGTYLTTDAFYRHEHAARTSPDNIEAASEPLEYDVLSGRLGIERELGRIRLGIDGGAQKITYKDSTSISGEPIDNSVRDRVLWDVGVKLSYQPVPDTDAYAKLRLRDISYENSTRDGGPDRDSTGFDLTFGLMKVVSDIWILNAYIAYAPGYYASGSIGDITDSDAIAMGASLVWNPTALTSVIGTFDRRTYETTQPGAAALVRTSTSVKVEHKLTKSLLVDAGVGYHNDDFANSGRRDDTYIATLGSEYYLTDLLSLRLAYRYQERDSNRDIYEYDKNSVYLQLRANY